jgi:hypothetical protein
LGEAALLWRVPALDGHAVFGSFIRARIHVIWKSRRFRSPVGKQKPWNEADELAVEGGKVGVTISGKQPSCGGILVFAMQKSNIESDLLHRAEVHRTSKGSATSWVRKAGQHYTIASRSSRR